jgi:prolycopene isomerase
MYISKKKGNFFELDGYLVHVYPENNTVTAYFNAPFKSKKYWVNNKSKILKSFIRSIDNHIIPGLSKHIISKEAATPYTLYKYTLNYKGAAYGWASIPSQLALPNFRKPFFIKNLYLTGHWTTQGIGIPGVTYLGYDTAKSLLKRENAKKL